MDPLQVVLQFLKEEAYHETFEMLLKEAETTYKPENMRAHVLRQSLGEIALTEQTHLLRSMTSGHKFSLGEKKTKVTYNASAVSITTYKDTVIAGFNDQSIRKISASNEVIQTVNPKLATILCFREYGNEIIFSTMGGKIAKMNPEDLSISATVQIENGAIVSLAVVNNMLFAASRAGFVALLNADDLSIQMRFQHGTAITAMCAVGNGVIYSVQNDSMFHFRSVDDPERELFLSMTPNELDVGCLDIRDMVRSPIDENVFIALTDQGRAHIYRYNNGSDKLDVLKILTHFISDGYSQPQLMWNHGPVVFSTSDDFKVIAIDVETDSLLFKIDGWTKATRCMTMLGDSLFVGAFDKTVSSFELIKK